MSTDSSKPSSLEAITAKGDYPATLAALRDRLAREIDVAEQPRDVAVLSARLSDVLAQLQTVKPPEKSVRDELAKKRTQRRRTAARKPGAADPAGAAGGK